MFTIKTEAEDSDESEMFTIKTEEVDFDETVVALDTYNSDLNLVIDASRFSAKPLSPHGFAYMWAGARATHGASKGKFCFEVKILDCLNVNFGRIEEPFPHMLRVGFSVESSTMQLGEDHLSYGYEGAGKIATNCKFQDYGVPFTAGDVILGAVDAESEQVQIGFAKNGRFQGWAFQVPETELKGHSLFPHILTKNISFEVNMGQKDQPYFPLPDPFKDFTFIGCLPLPQRESGTRPPNRKDDCEVIMMCGLPISGKSTWAAQHSANNPKKKYNILSMSNIRSKMKVMGLPHPKVPQKRLTKCLKKIQRIGSQRNRNYILDNDITPERWRKQLCIFDGFRRKAVVVLPSEAEYQWRRQLRNKDIQAGMKGVRTGNLGKNIKYRKANFELPEVSDMINEVIYTDLQKEDAEKLIIQYRNIPIKKKKKKLKKRKGRGRLEDGLDRNGRVLGNESDCNNGNFKNRNFNPGQPQFQTGRPQFQNPGGNDGSRGRKRKYEDSAQGASYMSLSIPRDNCKYVESVGNPFRRDSRAGRYFNSKMGGCHGSSSSNTRQWYGGNIFNQDSSHGNASGSQGEYSGEASQRSIKKEPYWP